MIDEEYKPYFLDSITKVDDSYYILNGTPQYEYDEDYYYEIHIKATYGLNSIRHYVHDYIYIDLISANKLEIYYGELYADACSDGEFNYTFYSYEKIEKTSKLEWKQKVKDLRIKLDNLLIEKTPAYMATAVKVIDKYQAIYQEHIENNNFGLTVAEIKERFPFKDLDGLFFNWSAGRYLEADFERRLSGLIRQYQLCRLEKDWEWDYLDLEFRFDNLIRFDLGDYNLIKNQIINIYTEIFERLLPWLKYNYKNIDEQKYKALFASIISTLDQTEDLQ